MDDKTEQEYTYRIPANFSQSNRIFGLRKRNIVEAIAAVILMGNAISLIPFVMKVKLIVMAVACAATAAIFLNGIHNRSITEWLFDAAKYRRDAKKLHFCSVRDEKKRKRTVVSSNTHELSYAEIVLNRVLTKVLGGDKDGKERDYRDTIKELKAKLGIG